MQEVFVVKENGFTVLFMPTRGLLMEVNNEEEKEILGMMKGESFEFQELLKLFPEIDENQLVNRIEIKQNLEEEFKPDSVVLFPSLDCNLRCIYCYSRGGERKENMKWLMAKAAIDLVIENAGEKYLKKSTLYFHGGGEPTYNWEIFKAAAEYFKKKAVKHNITPTINLVTNGMLSHTQIEWIANNIDSVQVSLDGTEDIQNFQRPTFTGGKSFDMVYNSAKMFVEKKMRIVLHATVTEKGICRMLEIARFICSDFPGQALHIEPVCECGRAVSNNQKFPNAERFVKGFIEAEKIASEFGVEIFYSAATSRLAEFKSSFCGVSVPNFIVAPSGIVSACHEVSAKTHFGAEFLIYGFFDEMAQEFRFDSTQIARLRKYTSQISKKCEFCFARQYCGGECFVKNLKNVQNKQGAMTNQRCIINKKLTKYFIMKRFLERR